MQEAHRGSGHDLGVVPTAALWGQCGGHSPGDATPTPLWGPWSHMALSSHPRPAALSPEGEPCAGSILSGQAWALHGGCWGLRVSWALLALGTPQEDRAWHEAASIQGQVPCGAQVNPENLGWTAVSLLCAWRASCSWLTQHSKLQPMGSAYASHAGQCRQL